MKTITVTFVNNEKRTRSVPVLASKLMDNSWAMPWLKSMLKQGWMIVP